MFGVNVVICFVAEIKARQIIRAHNVNWIKYNKSMQALEKEKRKEWEESRALGVTASIDHQEAGLALMTMKSSTIIPDTMRFTRFQRKRRREVSGVLCGPQINCIDICIL